MEIIKLHERKKVSLKNAVLVEGLPGIGSVSKITVDFLVSETKARHYLDYYSDIFPHSVFVDEGSVAHLPKVSMYYLKGTRKRRPIIFVSGDVQATTDRGSYALSEFVVKKAKSMGAREVITLGGIGRKQVPKKQGLHMVASSEKMKRKMKKHSGIMDGAYSVSMILGAAGLFLGVGEAYGMPGFSLLVDTFSHPGYLDFAGAKVLVGFLKEYLNVPVDAKSISEQEIMFRAKKPESINPKSLNYIG